MRSMQNQGEGYERHKPGIALDKLGLEHLVEAGCLVVGNGLQVVGAGCQRVGGGEGGIGCCHHGGSKAIGGLRRRGHSHHEHQGHAEPQYLCHCLHHIYINKVQK